MSTGTLEHEWVKKYMVFKCNNFFEGLKSKYLQHYLLGKAMCFFIKRNHERANVEKAKHLLPN